MPIDEIDFAVSCSATVTDEYELQLTKMGEKGTKLNDNVSKLINKRRNLNEYSHISECPGRNWKHIFFKLNEEVTKMGGKTYIIL